MASFKVSSNKRNYVNGCLEEFIKYGCYAVDIYGSKNRLNQCSRVNIGDTFYILDNNQYWKGTVKSEWIDIPLTSNNELNPEGFWYHVEYKRKPRGSCEPGNGLINKTQEKKCEVKWNPKPIVLSEEFKNILIRGFNAMTIKPLVIHQC